jgi:senataxin
MIYLLVQDLTLIWSSLMKRVKRWNQAVSSHSNIIVKSVFLLEVNTRCMNVAIFIDPNQLPPTIMSQAAVRLIYDQPLFKRLQKFMPVQLLNVQYRMHPDISRFLANTFIVML